MNSVRRIRTFFCTEPRTLCGRMDAISVIGTFGQGNNRWGAYCLRRPSSTKVRERVARLGSLPRQQWTTPKRTDSEGRIAYRTHRVLERSASRVGTRNQQVLAIECCIRRRPWLGMMELKRLISKPCRIIRTPRRAPRPARPAARRSRARPGRRPQSLCEPGSDDATPSSRMRSSQPRMLEEASDDAVGKKLRTL
jgi:hypothetical protein